MTALILNGFIKKVLVEIRNFLFYEVLGNGTYYISKYNGYLLGGKWLKYLKFKISNDWLNISLRIL